MTVLKSKTANNMNLNEMQTTFTIIEGFTLTYFYKFINVLNPIVKLKETSILPFHNQKCVCPVESKYKVQLIL
jgi:hypothetical protein